MHRARMLHFSEEKVFIKTNETSACNKTESLYMKHIFTSYEMSSPSVFLLFVLFIQAKTPNRAVENGVFHYPIGPFVLRVTAAFAISLI